MIPLVELTGKDLRDFLTEVSDISLGDVHTLTFMMDRGLNNTRSTTAKRTEPVGELCEIPE